jgi:metacaspase-1
MTAKKITMNELFSKLADPSVDERELKIYFKADPGSSRAFQPGIVINPATVQLPASAADAEAKTALALNLANGAARARRNWLFAARIADPAYKGPIIVSEGDSWFQFPILLEDVIDHLLESYAIKSLDAAGDTLTDIIGQNEFASAIEEVGASVFLMSAGGNDLVANGALASHLREFDSSLSASGHLLSSFDDLIQSAVATYDGIFRRLEQNFPQLHTICHGYDYPIPNSERWLGEPMTTRGITAPAFQKLIAHEMMDRFNVALAQTAAHFHNVTYIDCRRTVGDERWHDELHPDDSGFADVAARFQAVIDTLPREAPRAAPPKSAKPTAKTKAGASRAARAAGKSNRTGISLHIGLNAVDPVHYQGWSGELNAGDMQAIADQQHFKSTLLLTKNATRSAVHDAITAAAGKLKAGDLFLITYSGHGGQVPDYNQDEKPGVPDSTWCLYDAEHLDDESYVLWTKFAAGVRVVVVSDSCHSGSVIRAQIAGDLGADMRHARTGATARAMPHGVAARVALANRAFYRQLGMNQPALKQSALTRSIENPLRCSVRLFAGCQDEQLSYEQAGQGNYTLQLMLAWNNGTFSGNYDDFHKAICAHMPSHQTPNHMVIGQPNTAFDMQRPFEI